MNTTSTLLPYLFETLQLFLSMSENVDVLDVTLIISSPEPKAQGELIEWDSSRRPSVRASLRPSIHTFKH